MRDRFAHADLGSAPSLAQYRSLSFRERRVAMGFLIGNRELGIGEQVLLEVLRIPDQGAFIGDLAGAARQGRLGEDELRHITVALASVTDVACATMPPDGEGVG